MLFTCRSYRLTQLRRICDLNARRNSAEIRLKQQLIFYFSLNRVALRKAVQVKSDVKPPDLSTKPQRAFRIFFGSLNAIRHEGENFMKTSCYRTPRKIPTHLPKNTKEYMKQCVCQIIHRTEVSLRVSQER